MARTFADEIVETSSTSGTGAYSLNGAKGDYRTFRQGYSDGDTTIYYGVRNAGNTKWELNRGATLTYGSPDILTRGVFLSTNGNAAVSWVSADLPLTIYVPSAADVPEGVVTGWLSTARHALLRAGASWLDYTIGLATTWVDKLYLGGSAEADRGRAYISPAIYAASQRKLYVDIGAAGYALTANDIGKCFAFDTTAAARALTLLAAATAGIGHGFYVYVRPYGSATNGVTITTSGGDASDITTALPGRETRIQWDGAKSRWISDQQTSAPTQAYNDSSLLIANTTHVQAAITPLYRGMISGWTYANGSDATNDIDIAAGCGADSAGAVFIAGAALTKQSDAAWAVGNNQGGLDDIGSAGNNDFYIHAIRRPDTGVVDYLFSLSATAPTMPTNYTQRRLIGWFKRVGGSIVAFKTYELEGGGLEFKWNVPTLDIDLATTLTTARRTDALKVPLNFSVMAMMRANVTHGATPFVAWIGCPDETDAAPSDTAAPLANVNYSVAGTNVQDIRARTSAAGLIAARATAASITSYKVSTIGFEWSRR